MVIMDDKIYLNILDEQVKSSYKKCDVYFKHSKRYDEYYNKIKKDIATLESIQNIIFSNIVNIESEYLNAQVRLLKLNILMGKRSVYYWTVTRQTANNISTKYIDALKNFSLKGR